MSKSVVKVCPRCGTRSFESLGNYAHCVECLFVEDTYCDVETAYHAACRIEKELESAKVIKFPEKSKKKNGEAS